MANDLCKDEYEEYVAAMNELVEATEAARGFAVFQPLEPGQEAPEMKDDGKAAFRRVHKANEVYAEKYKAWIQCRKARGL